MEFLTFLFEEEDSSHHEIDPDRLLNAKSLIDFLPFLKHLRIIARDLPDDYYLGLLAYSELKEKSKIALAATVIYNSDLLLDPSVGSIFTYFYYQIKQGDYPYKEDIRFLVIHSLNLFFKEYLSKDLRPILREGLTTIIPQNMFAKADREVKKLVKNAFNSADLKFNKKYTQFIPLLLPRRKVPYYKRVIKELIRTFFVLHPNSSSPLVDLFNSIKLPLTIEDRKNWLTSIIECSTEYPPSPKELHGYIEQLEDLSSSNQLEIRLNAYITAWMLTNNIKYIKRGLRDPTKKVTKRCQNILKNPERELEQRKKRKKMEERKIRMLFEQGKTPKTSDSGKIDSVYVFEVSYGSISRTVALAGEYTLDDLHNSIQEVFEWDNDHLYAFFMNNRVWSELQAYYSPHDQKEPTANKKQIYTLSLIPNKRFLYLFDFGDNHRFQVTVKQITSQNEIPGPYPILLHERGKAPEQYPEWE